LLIPKILSGYRGALGNGTSPTPNRGRRLRCRRLHTSASTRPRLEQTLIQGNLPKHLKQMLGIFDDDRLTVCREQQHKR
jgi:hypothetical protein